MKPHELFELMRTCRQHTEVSGNAFALFAEICDAHQLKKGCILKDKTIAKRLNCTPRAVRNWLAQLVDLGFITKSQRDGHRLLIPHHPERAFRNEYSARNERSGTSVPKRKADSGTSVPGRNERSKEGGTSVPRQRDNIFPEGRESAPARESRQEEKEKSTPPIRNSDSKPVQIFVETVGRRPTTYETDRIQQKVTGAYTVWQKACQKSIDNLTGDSHRFRLGVLFDQYDALLERQRKRRRNSSGGDGAPSGMFGSGMTDFSEIVRKEQEAAHA